MFYIQIIDYSNDISDVIMKEKSADKEIRT